MPCCVHVDNALYLLYLIIYEYSENGLVFHFNHEWFKKVMSDVRSQKRKHVTFN